MTGVSGRHRGVSIYISPLADVKDRHRTTPRNTLEVSLQAVEFPLGWTQRAHHASWAQAVIGKG